MHGSDNLIHETKDFIELRGSPSLVGRGIANPQEYLLAFESYLASQNKRNARQILYYAQRYHKVVETGDASVLVGLSSGALRRHAMEALTAYAKYTGSYDKWQQIRKHYSLRWTNGDESIQALQRFFNPGLSLDAMLDVVRKMMQVLPRVMALVVRHAVLTGLRPNEACESVRLISLSIDKYYNPQLQALEHYKFPQLFLRTTKKAFISYLSADNLRPIANLGCKTPTWEAIRSTCKRRGINMDMRFCRKIHGSWLHQHNVTAEEIDFLQGRTSASIFSRHYLSPDNTLRDSVLTALEKLNKSLLLY
jgi:hypothetical protein